ncbi:MAG: fibronectin type III domain-containing protein [Gaiellaceae bacterium]
MPAARKHVTLAILSIALVAASGLAGAAGGVQLPGKRDREAPSAPFNVRVTSSSLTSVSLEWDAATDNVGVAFYYVYVDAQRARVSGTSYTATNLECGQSIGVWIVAYDYALNRSPSAAATVSTAACPDTQPPTRPTNFRQAATTQTAVVLEWDRSSDDVGVVGYGVYRDQLPVQSPSDPTVTLTGLVCNSTYDFQVDAVDAAGNRSERHSVWVQTAPCSEVPPPPSDATPPAQPADLRVAGVTAASVSLAWDSATDNVGVVGYDVYRNGTKMAHVTSTSSLQEGLACSTNYWFGVEAVDGAGNRSARVRTNATTSACQSPPTSWAFCAGEGQHCGFSGTKEVRYGQSGTFTPAAVFSNGVWCTNAVFGDPLPNAFKRCEYRDLGGTPPPPSDAPPADQSPPSEPTGLAIASVTQASVSLTWRASTDNVGVSGYGVYLNGNSVLTANQLGATLSALACGTAFTFAVDAFDGAGNRSTKAEVTASTAACAPDGQAPTAPTGVVASARTATSIALTWSASRDNVAVVGYGLYRGGALTGTSPTTTGIFSGLTCNTNYTLAVDAFDLAGNRSGKTTVLVATTECPDTSAPSSPTGLAVSDVTTSSLTLRWNASSDNVGVTGYDVARNGTKMESTASTTSSQTGLACGTSYWFGVEALDAAGNRSPRVSVNATTSSCPAPPPPPSSGRHVYCFGDPTYSGSGWQYDATSNGSVRQGYAQTLNQRVGYDNSVDVMRSVGCQTVKAEIQPRDPDANGGTANQRAQLYMSDGQLAKYGNQPSLDANVGKTSWYGFAFSTNSGYVPHYDPLFGNWNSIFSWHNAPINGVWGHLANIMLEVATIGPASGTEYRCGAPSTRLSQARLQIQLNGGDQADPNWPNESGRLTCRRYLGPVFEPGRRYRVEMLVTWGAHMNGSLQVWIDGTKFVDVAGISNVWYSGSTIDNGIYPVFENYRAYDTSLPTNTVYYGGLVKGSARSDVAIP